MATFYSSDWHSAPNGGAKYRLALTCTVASQNVAANTSTINWVLTIQKDRSYRGFYDYPANTRVRIDGTIVYDWDSYPTSEWPGWSEWTLASGSRTITHNSDGTRTFIVGAAWQRAASGWSPGSFDVSGTMVLPTIARATTPTVTPSPAATGAAVKISLPRASSAFTHDVTWASGTMSGTIGTDLATEATWIVPNVMGEFPGQSRAPITITVVTKNGATVIGSRQVTLQATAPPMAPEIKHLTPDQEYDIRAREVTWDTDTNEWKRGRILPTDSISMVDPSSATTTCSITMSKLKAVDFPDHSIIDIDVFDGENWRFTNHRFVLSRIEGDAADPSETYTYSGTEYIDYMLGFAYVPTDYKWTGASGEFGLTSAGNLVHYCIFKAKERGWGPRMGIGFDWAKTSFGDPWMNTNLNRTVSKGTPVSQVLDGMVNDGYVEYSTEYHTNQAWLVLLNPGTGASFADVGASPVVNLGLAELTRAPRRGTSEKRLTRVTVVGDVASGGKDPITATRERAPFDPNVFGHLEGWVSASGVKSGAEVGRIGDNALRDNASVVNERTFEYDAQGIAPQFRPYVVFKPGDWVLIPTDDGPITDRISQITISKTKDSKKITVLTGDRILSGVASLAKRQSAQTGGAIGGGNGTTPSQLDDRIPAAPIIDTVTSVGYWTTDGTARSEITVKWAPVTEAMSGSGIDIDIYEVWWREAVGGVWKFRAATSDTEIDMPDWEVLKNYELRVRARSAASVFGEFSENIEHMTPEPAVDLDGPILSDLYTDGLGNIYASWDGTLGGVPAPNRVGYIAAEVSSDGGTVYTQMGTPITAMGTIVIAPGSYGEFKVRLRAFDGLGNPGDASLPQTITTENPHINEVITLSSTTQALVSPSGGGATVPATSVITGTARNTTITTWEYSEDGAAFTATVPDGVSRNLNEVTVTGEDVTARTIAVRASDAHGAFDVITIAKLEDGAPGSAYTVLLSNESHTFPGTSSAAVAGSMTSRVFGYKGATAMPANVGTITGAPTGMTISVAANGTTAPIITVEVTTALVNQSGVLDVPVTVDGVTFQKSISWAVAWSTTGAKEPLPPTGITVVPGAGWDASGSFPDAWFDISWTPPTTDIEGDPIEIAGYDLWGKRTDEPEMRFLTSVAAPVARVSVNDSEEWSFQVCATSTHGAKSSLTPPVTSTANATTAPAPAPGVPSLNQYAGLLRILWSGAGMLPQIKTVYATIASSASGPFTRAGMPLAGAGEVVVPGLAPGQYWAKIVIVDERGAISTSAAAGPIQLLPITGVTIQTSSVANTGIKMTDAALTAYDVSGNPSFILDATTGEVWIAPYDSVFEFGASGTVAETGTPTTGVQISSEGSSFNTFIHSAGVQIRNDQTPLSWWEADASDASLVNFVAPRARVDNRFKVGDYEFLREAKAGGKGRLVIRYQGS